MKLLVVIIVAALIFGGWALAKMASINEAEIQAYDDKQKYGGEK
jgi:hypothetical protein